MYFKLNIKIFQCHVSFQGCNLLIQEVKAIYLPTLGVDLRSSDPQKSLLRSVEICITLFTFPKFSASTQCHLHPRKLTWQWENNTTFEYFWWKIHLQSTSKCWFFYCYARLGRSLTFSSSGRWWCCGVGLGGWHLQWRSASQHSKFGGEWDNGTVRGQWDREGHGCFLAFWPLELPKNVGWCDFFRKGVCWIGIWVVPKKLAEVDKLQMIGYMKMNGVEGCQNTKFCWSVPGLNGMWKGPVSIDILWNTWNLKTWKHTFWWSVETSNFTNYGLTQNSIDSPRIYWIHHEKMIKSST